MQNEEIMMRPKKKEEEEKKDYLSNEIKSLCSRVLVPERHCSTTQHDRASGFPQRGVRATHPCIQCSPIFLPKPQQSPYFSLQIASIINHSEYQL